MAERREHAPEAALRDAISLEMNACAIANMVPRSSIPGTRVRLTFHRDKECPWQDLHPHCIASEAIVSALDYMGIIGWSDTPVLPRAPLASKASECCWLSRIR